MRVALFSSNLFERQPLDAANQGRHELLHFQAFLNTSTLELARGFEAISLFVSDHLDGCDIERLQAGGTRALALRSAGFNHIDLAAARRMGLKVARVPAYSPHAVAEHTVGLMLALNRKIHRAYARVRDHNFSLEGLLGFDFHGRTVGVVGLGKIGLLVARIMQGFGCRVLIHDLQPHSEFPAVPLEQLLVESDVVTLHCPLTPDTHHLMNEQRLALMKPGAMLVNTSRGALLDTVAVIQALKSGHLGSLALDVYEEEESLFFQDLSTRVVTDDNFSRLLTFPNVLITAHQAFFTSDALKAIAETTVANLTSFEENGDFPAANRLV